MKIVRVTAIVFSVAAITIWLAGCYDERQVILMRGELVPMTQQDVVQMVKDGAPNSEVIREIRESGTVFRLSTTDIETLKSEGVPEEVINYMLATREVPPTVVSKPVVVSAPPAVAYDPWWGWDYAYGPGYYYYPSHIGLSFSYANFGRHWRGAGYGVHFSHWR